MIFSYLDKNPNIKDAAFIAESANIIGEVILHKGSNIWFNVVLRGDLKKIEIGEGSNIQDGTVCHVDHDFAVIVGKNVTVGHNVTLHACTIEDECLIGMGAVVLDGVIVGKGSLVAAGSVVPPRMIIPAGSMVAGVPAQIKRELTTLEKQKIINNGKEYLKLSENFKKGENL